MTRGCDAPTVASTTSPTSWATGTPMLPPPALMPSAQPLSRRGKKALMLVIEEAKLPPPTPANMAMINKRVERDARLQEDRDQGRRDEEQQRADHGPVAAAELGHREGVREPQHRPDQRRQGREQELLRRVEAVVRPEEEHQHRPQAPDREADVLAEDGEDQIALGDALALGFPERAVLGAPVVDGDRTDPRS